MHRFHGPGQQLERLRCITQQNVTADQQRIEPVSRRRAWGGLLAASEHLQCELHRARPPWVDLLRRDQPRDLRTQARKQPASIGGGDTAAGIFDNAHAVKAL